MAGPKVFVSYDHSEDVHYKRLLQAWDANTEFDFDFDSRGPNVPIDSDEAATVKQSLTRMMKGATHLLVIVGAKTALSKWVNWEIDRAKQADVWLKLAGVRIDKANVAPSGLLNTGTAWATSFTLDQIVAALTSARHNY